MNSHDMKEIIRRIQTRTLTLDMSECNWGEGVALWGFNRSVKAVPNGQYLPFLKSWVSKGAE